jgi:pyrrolidone-carboxylate peptidase
MGSIKQRVVLREIETNFDKAKNVVDSTKEQAKKDGQTIDLWIAIGEGSGVAQFERVAKNRREIDSGFTPSSPKVDPKGKDSLSPMYIDKIVRSRLRIMERYFPKYKIEFHNTPDSFICNETLYVLCQERDSILEDVGFFHVPELDSDKFPDSKQTLDIAGRIASIIFKTLREFDESKNQL